MDSCPLAVGYALLPTLYALLPRCTAWISPREQRTSCVYVDDLVRWLQTLLIDRRFGLPLRCMQVSCGFVRFTQLDEQVAELLVEVAGQWMVRV